MHLANKLLACLALTASLAFSGAALAAPIIANPMPAPYGTASADECLSAFECSAAMVLVEVREAAYCAPVADALGNCPALVQTGTPKLHAALATGSSAVTRFNAIERGPPG